MEQITQYGTVIGSILFGLYLVARGIVWFTPTPKDDAEIEKVGGIVVALAKIVGLDVKQGVNLPSADSAAKPAELVTIDSIKKGGA